MRKIFIAALLATAPLATPAAAEMPTAEIVAQADATVGLNGLVCDFCAIALNKIFSRQDEVAATHVDLDAKTLSIVFKDGQSIADERLRELVKKAGYKATDIVRAS